MSYVVYTSISATERQYKSKLGKFTSWVGSRLAGTFLNSTFSFLFDGSIIIRYATAITIGIFVGLLFDYSFSFLPIHSTNPYVCTILGALACFASRGGGTIPIGCFWGWLIGAITDIIACEIISDPFSDIRIKIISWFFTCLCGWWISLVAQWLFNKRSPRSSHRKRFTTKLFMIIALTAPTIFIYHLTYWLFSTYQVFTISHAWLSSHWYMLILVILWTAVAIYGALIYLIWKSEYWYNQSNDFLRNYAPGSDLSRDRYYYKLKSLPEHAGLNGILWLALSFVAVALTVRLFCHVTPNE